MNNLAWEEVGRLHVGPKGEVSIEPARMYKSIPLGHISLDDLHKQYKLFHIIGNAQADRMPYALYGVNNVSASVGPGGIGVTQIPRIPVQVQSHPSPDEEAVTKRICVAPTIYGCIAGLAGDAHRDDVERWLKDPNFQLRYHSLKGAAGISSRHHVSREEFHGARIFGVKEIPEGHVANSIIQPKVFDADITGEEWLTKPTRFKYLGLLRTPEGKEEVNVQPNVHNMEDFYNKSEKMEDLLKALVGERRSGVERRAMPREGVLDRRTAAILSRLQAGKYKPEDLVHLERQLTKSPLVGHEAMHNKAAWQNWSKNAPPGVHVMVDLAGLKETNNLVGQHGADRILRNIGRMKADAAQRHGGTAFHIGGDEFAYHFEDPMAAKMFIRDIAKGIDAFPAIKGRHFHAFSIGVGANPKEADLAAYKAKGMRQGYQVGMTPTFIHSTHPELPFSGPFHTSSLGATLGKPRAVQAAEKQMNKSEYDTMRQELQVREELRAMSMVHKSEEPITVYELCNTGEAEMIKSEERFINLLTQKGAVNFGFLKPEDAVECFGEDAFKAILDMGYAIKPVAARQVWTDGAGKVAFQY